MVKREKFEAILDILSEVNTGAAIEVDPAELEEFKETISHELALMDARKAADKERAEERKKQGDATRALVQSKLSAETEMSVVDVMKAIDNDNYTPAIITARLSQLVKNGIAESRKIKTEFGTKTVYKLV